MGIKHFVHTITNSVEKPGFSSNFQDNHKNCYTALLLTSSSLSPKIIKALLYSKQLKLCLKTGYAVLLETNYFEIFNYLV